MQLKSKKSKQLGFTLIELLIVIAIIGLLSIIVTIAVGQARVKARNAKRLSDYRVVSTALSLYYQDNGHYPYSTGTSKVCLGPVGEPCNDGGALDYDGDANVVASLGQYLTGLPRTLIDSGFGKNRIVYRSYYDTTLSKNRFIITTFYEDDMPEGSCPLFYHHRVNTFNLKRQVHSSGIAYCTEEYIDF